MQCTSCGKDNLPNANFCIGCGRQLQGARIDYADANKKYFVQTILLFLSVVIVIILSLQEASGIDLLTHEIVFNSMLLVIIVVFVLFDLRNFLRLFKWNIRLKPLLILSVFAASLALIVIMLADVINNMLQLETVDYYVCYQTISSQHLPFGLFFVSVLPGFFEEMLFRGVLFNNLLRFTTPKMVILITAILFSFIHFSFFSVIWLFFIGLVLGYLRFRYRTIWYSIYFHCLYNAAVYLLEIVI